MAFNQYEMKKQVSESKTSQESKNSQELHTSAVSQISQIALASHISQNSQNQQINTSNFNENLWTNTQTLWAKNQCDFSKLYKTLTGRDLPPCGNLERPHQTCKNCEKKEKFHMRLEWCREVPAKDQPLLNKMGIANFPLPNGDRLAVFSALEHIKLTPWANNKYVHEKQYVYVSSTGIPAICLENCAKCKQMEIRPVYEVYRSGFCSKGDFDVKYKNEKTKIDNLPLKPPTSATKIGKPNPYRFVFTKDNFPMTIILPANVLLKRDMAVNGQSNARYIDPKEIVVYIDDVLIPFRVINNIIHIDIHSSPFGNLNKPNEYDHLAVSVQVFMRGGKRNCKVQFPVINNEPNMNTSNLSFNNMAISDSSLKSIKEKSLDINLMNDPIYKSNTQAGSAVEVNTVSLESELIYKSTFRFYMKSPENADIASDSDSDSDENEIENTTRAKRRYPNLGELLKLNMSVKAKNILVDMLQGYLKGGFFIGSEKDLKVEKHLRNGVFAEIMKGEALPAYVADMLLKVGKYYVKNCKNNKDFQEAIMQLLDFSHALGIYGKKTFYELINMAALTPTIDKPLRLRFSRGSVGETTNILVIVFKTSNDNELKLLESIEYNNYEDSNDKMDRFLLFLLLNSLSNSNPVINATNNNAAANGNNNAGVTNTDNNPAHQRKSNFDNDNKRIGG